MGKSVKSKVIDNILIEMSRYVAQGVLKIIEEILVKEFVDIDMEDRTTLPVEVRDSVSEQNSYVIQLFLYKKSNLKDSTKIGYLSAVKRLVVMMDKSLYKMDETDIFHYLDLYEKRNLKLGGSKNQATTVNNERRFLSAFFGWMRKEKLRADNPVEVIEAKKVPKKPIDYFNSEEMEKLKEGCRGLRDRAMMEVLRSTGARVGEVIAINRYDIDWVHGDILICGEKSDRYRVLYLDVPARHHLKKYLDSRNDDGDALFVSSRKPYQPISRCGIRAAMKQVANRAGVTCRVYPHKMRKTLGMELKNKGVDIGTISEIMGHADTKVTALYYAQSTPDTLRVIRQRAA